MTKWHYMFKRFRFSLRSWLLIFVLFAIPAAYLGANYVRFSQLKELESYGFEFTLEGEERYTGYRSMGSHSRLLTFWEFLRKKPIRADYFLRVPCLIESEKLVSIVCNFPSIKNLDASHLPLAEEVFVTLAEHSTIVELAIQGPMNSRVAKHIGRMTQLRALQLNCLLTEDQWRSILTLPNLESIASYGGNQSAESHLAVLCEFDRLRTVHLASWSLRSDDLVHLNKLKELHTLTLANAPVNSLAAIEGLEQNPSLCHASILGAGVTRAV